MFRIAVIAAAGDRVAQRWLGAEFDLRLMEWRVLGVIRALQPIRFAGIAQQLFVDKGQLSRLVTSLRRRGLVGAEPDPEDHRTVRLTVTPDGCSLHDRVLARAAARNALVAAALEPEEQAMLFALLDKLQPIVMQRAATGGQAMPG